VVFSEYFQQQILNKEKHHCFYLGISKKDFPKWAGWKIIKQYKDSGVLPSEIQDKNLDVLVENFYYLKFIKLHKSV
jgi:hypothetical protein